VNNVKSMKGHEIVGVHRANGVFELDIGLKKMRGCPVGEDRIFRQTVATDSKAGPTHVVVGAFSDADGPDDVKEVDSGFFGEECPLEHESNVSGTVSVFKDLGHFRGGGAGHEVEGKVGNIEDVAEKFPRQVGRDIINASVRAPEVSDGADVLFAGHDTLVGMRDSGGILGCVNASLLEFFNQGWLNDFFACSGGHGGLDEDKGIGLDMAADGSDSVSEGCEVTVSLGGFSEGWFGRVKLDVNHHDVGELIDMIVPCRAKGLLVDDAAGEYLGDFRVVCVDWGLAAVDDRDFPEGPT